MISVLTNRVVLLEGEPEARGIFLGVLDGRHCWAIDADDDTDDGVTTDDYVDLRALWGSVDEPTWVVAGRAVQLVELRTMGERCRSRLQRRTASQRRLRQLLRNLLLVTDRCRPRRARSL